MNHNPAGPDGVIPQQVSAYRHHNHNNNHNANSVKVDQQINQLNSCTGVPSQAPGMRPSAPSHSENTR
jgi:hypothetical protein